MTRTSEDFLSAIHAAPDDDSLRLVYADWLDERATEAGEPIPCPRSELIRVQIELSRSNPSIVELVTHCPLREWDAPEYARVCHLWQRERYLISDNDRRWRNGPVCGACHGNPTFSTPSYRCNECHGTGDAGGLMIRASDPAVASSHNGWAHQVDYVCGMKRVHATLAECCEQVPCPICSGPRVDVACGIGGCSLGVVWQPTPWLRSVLTHHPDVVEIWVTDREPTPIMRSGRERYFWHESTYGPLTGMTEISSCPSGVFDQLEGANIIKTAVSFDSVDAARTALARAVVRWARSR